MSVRLLDNCQDVTLLRAFTHMHITLYSFFFDAILLYTLLRAFTHMHITLYFVTRFHSHLNVIDLMFGLMVRI